MSIFLMERCFFSWFIPWNSKGQRSLPRSSGRFTRLWRVVLGRISLGHAL